VKYEGEMLYEGEGGEEHYEGETTKQTINIFNVILFRVFTSVFEFCFVVGWICSCGPATC